MLESCEFTTTKITINQLSCTVICGDSREVLKKFVNSANLIVTSPPYADARKKHYDSISPDEFTEWFFTFHNSFFNSLLEDGSFILNIKDKVVNGVRHRFVWDTIKNLSENGWYAIDDYIWHKTNPMPGFWPSRLSDGWEYCFHLSKTKTPFFNRDEVKKPIGEWSKSRLRNLSRVDLSRHNSSNESGFGRDISKWVGKSEVSPTNVIDLPLVGKNKNHPAVFPVDLPLFFIKLLCPPGGLVIDPFGGSGTTGIAAFMAGRNSIIIDNNPDYCEEAVSRIRREISNEKGSVWFLPGIEG